ncbi:MAG: (d)CMP kinase [Kiritimatiellae bacterium]|nr:(d)CMP kinase [Kiritimatiellia bacterium]MBR1837907.1 (d)CMP kinase [Kiritimatiellia bacterium]
MHKVICIDGPSGSGKSTTARAVAEREGVLFVDSGALYRIMTWRALEAGVDCRDAAAVAAFCKGVKVDFVVKGNRVAYEVDGEEPGDRIRTPEINANVSPVSAVPEVRAIVTGWLREMPKLGDIVVEGRDIGSVVYPDSPYRFYLDCDPDERARRRQKEDAGKGFVQTEAQVKASLLARDKIDSSRKTAPLKVPEGAIRIDTTHLSVAEVVDAIAKAAGV